MANGDNIGTRPSWLPDADQSGTQLTNFGTPIPIDAPGMLSVLYQISNGGGSFDVGLGFLSGRAISTTLSGADWFGGAYAGTSDIDNAAAGQTLNLVEGRST